MGKGLQTREAIVGEALRQASRVGLEGLSLAPLADSLSLSKSGLFAHFKSKEALQLEILEEAIERFKRQVVLPSARERDPKIRLRNLFERYLGWIRGSAEDGGCLFMTMIQEYDDRPGEIRDRLVDAQREWRQLLAELVRQASSSRLSAAQTDQMVFEIVGTALAFQHASKLLGDRSARRKAMTAFDTILSNLRS